MEKKIKKCVSECRWNFGIQIFMVLGFTFVFGILGLMATLSWWSIPISFVLANIMVFINTNNSYFSFQEISTSVRVETTPNNILADSNIGKSEFKLGYVSLEILGDSDTEGKSVCKITHIDGKYVEGVNIIIPKSEIFKKEKFYWKQSFKPIG